MSRVPEIALAIAFASNVFAADHPLDARKLALRDTSSEQSFSWVTTFLASPLPASSPTAVGAVLHIAAENGESVSWSLPASGWTVNDAGTVYHYRNPLAPGGPSPVKVAVLKNGRMLKVAAKESGLTLDEVSQGTIQVQLTVGSDVYCSDCTTAVVDEVGRYTAKRCPAPSSCTGVGSGVCGDGVIDDGEDCDLGNPGVCAMAPPSLPVSCEAPGTPNECTCCGQTQCVFGIFVNLRCCADSQCQDTTGAGSQRIGACIPPTCGADADCHGYRCVDGTCCGNAGQFCGVAGCCPDSGTSCTYIPSALNTLCCRLAGTACGGPTECCSFSCTNGLCD